jgi:hypothetical protein
LINNRFCSVTTTELFRRAQIVGFGLERGGQAELDKQIRLAKSVAAALDLRLVGGLAFARSPMNAKQKRWVKKEKQLVFTKPTDVQYQLRVESGQER